MRYKDPSKVQQGLKMRRFCFRKKTMQLKTAHCEVYLCTKWDFFSKNSVSPRLLAKIRVSQGYCYVVQCTVYVKATQYQVLKLKLFSPYFTISGFPPFLIEEKDEEQMPQLYIILYTLLRHTN